MVFVNALIDSASCLNVGRTNSVIAIFASSEIQMPGSACSGLNLAVDSERQLGFGLCKYHKKKIASPFSYLNLLELSNLARFVIHPNAEMLIGKTSIRTVAK